MRKLELTKTQSREFNIKEKINKRSGEQLHNYSKSFIMEQPLKGIKQMEDNEDVKSSESETEPLKPLNGEIHEHKEVKELKAKSSFFSPMSENSETNFDAQPIMTGNAMSEEMINMAKFKEL